MKHMIRNDELKKRLFKKDEYPDLVIYSCQFDNGKLAENRHIDMLSLGDDGMKIWFFPCFSCQQQIRLYGLEPIIQSAVKDAVKEQSSNKFNIFRKPSFLQGGK